MIVVSGTVQKDEEKAILLRLEGGRDEWFPKSKITVFQRIGLAVVVGIPNWLAETRKINHSIVSERALKAPGEGGRKDMIDRKGEGTGIEPGKGKGRKLVEMRLKNIMRVKAAIIKPEGRVTVLEGDNDQGKTGVVSGFFIPLLGKAALPKEPLRRGTDRGWSYLDFGDLKVRRVFTAEGNEYLGVRVAGMEPRRPQEIIDKMLGAAAGKESMFDPMEIVRMGRSPEGRRARMKMLLAMGGYDYDADEAKRSELFADRKAANKNLARLTTLVSECPPADDPGEEPKIDEAALRAEIVKEEARERGVIQANSDLAGKERLLEEVKRTIERLEKELDAAREREGEVVADIIKAKAAVGKQAPPRTGELRAKLEEFRKEHDAWQAKHARAIERESITADHAEAQEESDRLTKELEAIGERRAGALAGIRVPIDGLGYDRERDCLTWHGEILEQVAESDQLLVGMTFLAGMLPEDGIRVCRFDNWDNLNPEHQAKVRELAEKLDLDVLAVRVSKEKHSNTLWISDGLCPDDLPEDIEEMDWDPKPKGKGKGKAEKEEPVEAVAPAGGEEEQIEML